MTPSSLPFEAPPFDKIQDGDFAPAFEAGIKRQLEEIAAIADDPAAPTFENTLVALERSGQLLRRVGLVFNALTSANTNPALQKVQQDVAPKLAAQEDAIFLNAKLFTRVEAIHARRDELKLDPESSRLVDYYYRHFVRAGARLSDADKTKLRALNEQDASLSATFTRLLLAATKGAALVAGDAAELAGLSKGELEAASLAATGRGLEGKWLIPLLNTTQQPMLQSLSNRATRERLFRASWSRAERGDANDTRQIVTTLAGL
ncbi:MAG: dipeptidyl carboxypeptidase II, partial [Rhodospirillaceae bacterium]